MQKSHSFFLFIFLLIQIFDFSNSLNTNLFKEKRVRDNELNDPIWKFISENYDYRNRSRRQLINTKYHENGSFYIFK